VNVFFSTWLAFPSGKLVDLFGPQVKEVDKSEDAIGRAEGTVTQLLDLSVGERFFPSLGSQRTD
jgi:hypothetical protein